MKFDHFGGAVDLALIMASFQGGMLVAGLLMSVIKGFKKKMLAITSFTYVVFLGYALVALTSAGLFWFMAIAASIMAFGIPIINVSYLTIIQTVVPLKMQGRVNSVDMALSSAAQPFGMILSGAMVEFTGTTNLFLGCVISGMLILTLSWFLTDIKYIDKMEENSTNKLTKVPVQAN